MPIRIDEKRTSSYIGTFYVEDASDMLELAELKKMVRNMNNMLKEDKYDYRFRVVLHGRLGKNNPAAPKYRYRQDVKLSDAIRIDAYINKDKKCLRRSKVNGKKSSASNPSMATQSDLSGWEKKLVFSV